MNLKDRNTLITAAAGIAITGIFVGVLFWPLVQGPESAAPPPMQAAEVKPAEVKLPMPKLSSLPEPVRTPQLTFIVLVDGGKPVLYEVAKGTVDQYLSRINYTNTEGVVRTWSGAYLTSQQPIKLNNAATMIASPTALSFKVD
jgi:hypothetical protein